MRRRAFASPELRRYAIEAHEQILDRIAAGDADGARDAMRRHLEVSGEHWAPDEQLAGAPTASR